MARRDPLKTYRAKRDFSRTHEPSGEDESTERGTGPRFVVQQHAATRLHWDFRLEADGVLKSWAVTRGPSADPADKRLAVRTEDHPLSYAGFEGNIPEGEYGGGTVMVWDRGTWEPVAGKSARDLAAGHLHFRLKGERMQGEWLLVRMKPRSGEKRENWLLRKVDDDAAAPGSDLVGRHLTSVLTGRSMAQIAADRAGTQSLKGKRGKAFAATMAQATQHTKAAAGKRRAHHRKAALPAFEPVQLATLVESVPSGPEWLHEIKFDGYRILAAVAGPRVGLYTRSGLDWTDRFPSIAQALAALDLPAALIDGELVALDAKGNPSFAALQAALTTGETAHLAYFTFDLLSLEGRDLKPLPTSERKERLAALLGPAGPPLRLADHVIGAGERLYAAMCQAGQEGIVSKRADAPYRGERARAWLKTKCSLRQEFVIVGHTASTARGRPFGALLLAQRQQGELVYKGKVGTGFDAQRLDELARIMAPLASQEPALSVPRAKTRGARWLRPELVAEIDFAQFTSDGRVRHGRFVGLRQDKAASEVTAETPVATPEPSAEPPAAKVTHPDRVVFPARKLTKGDLAAYYQAVAPLLLPFAAHRPLSLVRCPQGVGGHCFFQKHAGESFGQNLQPVMIAEKDGQEEAYISLADSAGLLDCVQMGTIEFHAWAARSEAVERPDRMVFDLDPDEGLDFAAVTRAAQTIRRQLADIGLVSFAMLSGGKGVHVIVPLSPGHTWDRHKDFAHRFAEALALHEPARFTATMSKAKRKGRIFIDWLRNQRGSTAIVPYSARARDTAAVAAPVSWAELDEATNAHRFTIADADELIERAKSSALSGWGLAEQALPEV